MFNNRKICRIAAYGSHCTWCNEPSNTNNLSITIQMSLIQARIYIQQHIFKIAAARLVFLVLLSLICQFLLIFNTRITVAKGTSLRYATSIHIPSQRYNENLPTSVEVEVENRFRGLSWCVRYVYRRHCGIIPSCHGNTSADVTNNQTYWIQLNVYSLHYGIMYVIE